MSDLRTELQTFQLEMLQDYFAMCMEHKYGENWVNTVVKVSRNRLQSIQAQQSDDWARRTYSDVVKAASSKGTRNLTKRDLDVTNITTFLLADFFSDCCPNNDQDVYKKAVDSIRKVKNNYFSHLKDFNDEVTLRKLEGEVLETSSKFLNFIDKADLPVPGKGRYVSQQKTKYRKLEAAYLSPNKSAVSIKITVEDTQGKYVSGCKLSLHSDTALISSWTSVDEPFTVSVYPGKYTVIQERVPAGFRIGESTNFFVSEGRSAQVFRIRAERI